MIWLLIAICLLVSFVFSGIEAGILSVNRVRLAHRVRLGERSARMLERLVAHPERLLITVLIITNLANILSYVILTRIAVAAWGGWGYIIALAACLPLYLFGMEFLPKAIFRRFPYRALAAMAGILRLAETLLLPIHLIGSGVQRILFRGGTVMEQRVFLAREDFKHFAAEGEKTGTLTRDESAMITSVVDFRTVVARDVMRPLDPSRVLPADASVAELLERSARTPHDRWLVSDDHGRVTGVVSVFEVLLERRRDVSIGVYQRRIVHVAPSESAYSVLRKLRATRGTLATVGTPDAPPQGVVAWGDLIQKIVATAPVK